jgi:predicted nucleic acid-binding Zn ribbon protein
VTIESIRSILRSLNQGAAWQQQQEFDRLVKFWSEVVGPVVSQHARPVELRDGGLLVATSNAVWAQQLRFECPRILAKLNSQLAQPLQEIRFSPARWHQIPLPAIELSGSTELRHPCRRSRSDFPGVSPQAESNPTSDPPKLRSNEPVASTSQAAFQQWADRIQARSQGLPLCPQCFCPTPLGELQHWSVCALCAVKIEPESR